MKRILNALLLTILSLQVASAQSSEPTQAPDSVKVSELDEIVVEGKNATAKAGSISVIPQKQQINASATGYDLLFHMSIPVIQVNPSSETVTNNFGNSVALFINGMPATNADVRALRPKDVLRVDYLEAPQEARYAGNQYVINYVLKERLWGGYTKILGSAKFLNRNTDEVNAYSNFVYKRMSYDLYAGWNYNNSHHFGGKYLERYSLLSPEGITEILERERNTTYSRAFWHSIPITFRATYNSKKVQVINSLYFSFSDQPRSIQHDELLIRSQDENQFSGKYFTDDSSTSRSASWYGWLNLSLPKNYSVNVTGQLYYLNGTYRSNYESVFLDSSSSIINNSKENTWYTRWDVVANKWINNRISLGLIYSFSFRDGKIDYWGTSPGVTKLINTSNSGGVNLQAIWQKLHLTVNAGVTNERTTTGGNSLNYTYPYTHVFLNYSPSSSHQFSLQLSYAATTPGVAAKSDNTIKSNEFLYIKGNPNLKNYPHFYTQLGYNWFPRNNFSASFFGAVFHNHDIMISDYEHYDEGEALIKTYINNGNFNKVAAGVSLQYAPIRTLQIRCNLVYQYFNFNGKVRLSQNNMPANITLRYYLRNFNFFAVYGLPMTTFRESLTRAYERDVYGVGVGWSKNELNISVNVYNFFRTKWKGTHSIYEMPLYSIDSWNIDPSSHARVQLKIAYTFGYGKKVERGNEIGAQEGIESGVLK